MYFPVSVCHNMVYFLKIVSCITSIFNWNSTFNQCSQLCVLLFLSLGIYVENNMYMYMYRSLSFLFSVFLMSGSVTIIAGF